MKREWNRKRQSIVLLILILVGTGIAQTSSAQAISTCEGYYSSSNPYPCCTAGNCTWWAWKMATENWRVPLPKWGNAWQWASGARASHYGIETIPAPGTIAVNTTVNGTGHVAWVISVDATYVYVTEMNCNLTKGMRQNRYLRTWFNGGYIYPQPNISSIYPQPNWSIFNRTYTLYGNGFKSSPLIKLVGPGGVTANLSGSQVNYVDGGRLMITYAFGRSGIWSLQVQNKDGGWSNQWSVYVF